MVSRWSPAQPPVSAGSRSASPCSSSGTPSPRVIPVVVPSGNHYIRAAVAPTTLCDMAEPVRLGSTKRAPITPEFSDSEGEEEEEGCLVASRGTANLGALGGQAINYRATSRPLAPESADEDRRRRRSSSPQVLPWRVASTTIQQGLLLTADARPGVLQCGSRQLAVLGSAGVGSRKWGGEIWYAGEKVTSSCAADLKGRIVVIDNVLDDWTLIRPAQQAGAAVVLVALDGIPEGCRFAPGCGPSFPGGCAEDEVPIFCICREDVVQARIRPLSHVEISLVGGKLGTQDKENLHSNKGNAGASKGDGGKHNGIGSWRRRSRSPEVLSLLSTPNGSRKAKRMESSSGAEAEDKPLARFEGAAARKATAMDLGQKRQAASRSDSVEWAQEGSDFVGEGKMIRPQSSSKQGSSGVVGLLQRWGSPSVSRASSESSASLQSLSAPTAHGLSPRLDIQEITSYAASSGVCGDASAESAINVGGERVARPVARALLLTSSSLSAMPVKSALSEPLQVAKKLLALDPSEMSRSLRLAYKRFASSKEMCDEIICNVAESMKAMLHRLAWKDKQREGALRLRELCRVQRESSSGGGSSSAGRVQMESSCGGGGGRAISMEWAVVDMVVEEKESIYTLAEMLGNTCNWEKSRQMEDCVCDGCSGQRAASACAQHLALDDCAGRGALATCANFVNSLAKSLTGGACSEVRHRVAACVANLALEHNDLRELLCCNKSLLSGLEHLFSQADPQSVDFSLAAFANLSIDPCQAPRIMEHIRLDKIVMILTIGLPKSQHRGAGLVRNLLFCKESLGKMARVPGIVQALQRLQTSETCSETRTRAAVALSMLRANRSAKRDLSGSELENRLFSCVHLENAGVGHNSVSDLDEGDSYDVYGEDLCNLDADLATLHNVPLIRCGKQHICPKKADGLVLQDDDYTRQQRLVEQGDRMKQMAEILRVKKSEMGGDKYRAVEAANGMGGRLQMQPQHQQFSGFQRYAPPPVPFTSEDLGGNLAPREPMTDLCVNASNCLKQSPGTAPRPPLLPHLTLPPVAEISPCLTLPPGFQHAYRLPVSTLQGASTRQCSNLSAPVTPRATDPSLGHVPHLLRTASASALCYRVDSQASGNGDRDVQIGTSATNQSELPRNKAKSQGRDSPKASARSSGRHGSPSIFKQVSRWFSSPR